MNVLILGPQGSGKGTQAKLIAKTYGIPHIATGTASGDEGSSGTPVCREVKAVSDAGGSSRTT